MTTRARSIAIPVAACAAASIPPAHLLAGCTREDIVALVTILGKAADPVQVRAIVAGVTDPRDLVLRRAHVEATRLRARGEPIPVRLGYLEAEYQTTRKAAQRELAAAEEAAARDRRLKDANAEVQRLRKANEPAPRELLVLAAEYRRDRRRRQQERAA